MKKHLSTIILLSLAIYLIFPIGFTEAARTTANVFDRIGIYLVPSTPGDIIGTSTVDAIFDQLTANNINSGTITVDSFSSGDLNVEGDIVYKTLTATTTLSANSIGATIDKGLTISGTATTTNLVVNTNSKLGTVSSGTWNGSTVGVQYGGTGTTSLTGLLLGNGTSAFTGTTTSAGIANTISDETGSGALCFATSPSFTTGISTPAINTASGALTITPASGSNLNVNLATTGDFAVNTSQLYVDTSSGMVGIGTTSPSQKLTIYDSSQAQMALEVPGAGDQWNLISDPAGKFRVYSNDTASTRLTIDTAGNVGIGTTAPGSKLDIYGAVGDADTNLRVRSGDTGAGNPHIDLYQGATQKAYFQYIDSGDYLRIVDNGIVGIVQKSGNVGIGTTTPTVVLQATNANSNATTTIEFGKSGQNKGTCLKMYNTAGTLTYCSISGTTFSCSATSCE